MSTSLPPADLTITDQAILHAARERALAEGRTDWRVWLREKATVATRAVIGMDADLSVRDAAIYLGLCRNTIWNYHADGRLPGLYYVSAKKAMIPIRDLDAIKGHSPSIKERAA